MRVMSWLALNVCLYIIGYGLMLMTSTEYTIWHIPVYPIVLLPVIALNGFMLAINGDDTAYKAEKQVEDIENNNGEDI